MLSLRCFAILGVLLISACLGQGIDNPADDEGEGSRRVSPQIGGVMTESFETLSGDRFVINRPKVILIAAVGCIACAEEIHEYRSAIESGEIGRNELEIYSIIVGVDPSNSFRMEKARNWIQDHGVMWNVGIDPRADVLRKYCPDDVTPCVIVERPDRGIVYQENGKLSLQRLRALIR